MLPLEQQFITAAITAVITAVIDARVEGLRRWRLAVALVKLSLTLIFFDSIFQAAPPVPQTPKLSVEAERILAEAAAVNAKYAEFYSAATQVPAQQPQHAQTAPVQAAGYAQPGVQAAGYAQPAQAALGTAELPSGWVAAQDPSTGVTYYSNASLGLTQWEMPVPPAPVVIPQAPMVFLQSPPLPPGSSGWCHLSVCRIR